MWNLLTSLPNEIRSATPWEATVYALLGFTIVFMGIAFLIFVVWLIGKIMNKTIQPKTKEKTSKIAVVEASMEDEVSDEVVAIIMAALTAYYEENNPKCEFTVKRIKRI